MLLLSDAIFIFLLIGYPTSNLLQIYQIIVSIVAESNPAIIIFSLK